MEGLHDSMLWLQVAVVVTLWTFAAFLIRRWGPGRRKCSVYCPETSRRAKVAARWKEGDWGTFHAAEITACSRFPGGPVTCQKQCLARL